ncbi:NADPH-dependent FMN reductase [Novosphingobium olei]|uniref:NADPH-dependent FMN reductase n=1 Tax=Novosphingobium olei TaxID=2728851 RepID=UPI00308F36B8|nr:NAD(P)H-dependent oxidoreductase [Novosphingobium olei]
MIRLIGVSGSLRSASFNTALLRTAAELMPAGATLNVHTLHGVPLYDADVEEADGIPGPVAALKEAVATADGVILGTPEYNNGIPGVFKNAIDWASRPPEDSARVFKDRPFAIIGASPGGFGTILSQNHWLPVLRTLGVDLWPGGRLLVSHAAKVIGEDGKVIDQETRDQIERFIAGFVSYLADRGRAKST